MTEGTVPTHIENVDANILNRGSRRVQDFEYSNSENVIEVVVFGNLWVSTRSVTLAGGVQGQTALRRLTPVSKINLK